tara:strand:- start:617 stop:1231 length:615 start_codon:yes stop_codon:yes gene_type:complete
VSILLLALIIIGLGALVILVASLFDRLNVIEKLASENRIVSSSETSETIAEIAQISPSQKIGAFGVLSGESLWEAMSGNENSKVPSEELERMRPRYQFVLTRHITTLFDEGKLDAKQGFKNIPGSSLPISTLRGSVESWMPSNEASTLYQLGRKSADLEKNDINIIIQDVDEITKGLFSQVNLNMTKPMSSILLRNGNEKSGEE